MTTFEIEAPEDRSTLEWAVNAYVADWFLDACHGMTTRQIARAYSEQIISEIERPAKPETARKRLLSHWTFLRALAEHDQPAFDHVIQAFADRLAESARGGSALAHERPTQWQRTTTF